MHALLSALARNPTSCALATISILVLAPCAASSSSSARLAFLFPHDPRKLALVSRTAVTHLFVHAGAQHFLWNLLGIDYYARRLRPGFAGTWALFLGGGLAGLLAQGAMFYSPRMVAFREKQMIAAGDCEDPTPGDYAVPYFGSSAALFAFQGADFARTAIEIPSLIRTALGGSTRACGDAQMAARARLASAGEAIAGHIVRVASEAVCAWGAGSPSLTREAGSAGARDAVAHAAHVGGFLGGAAIALFLLR